MQKALVRIPGRLAVQEKSGDCGTRLRHQGNSTQNVLSGANNPSGTRLRPWAARATGTTV
jgi:hypothetical protein